LAPRQKFLTSLTNQRNALVPQIRTLLEDTEFGGQQLNSPLAIQLTAQANGLLKQLYSYTGGKIPLQP